MQIVSLCTYTYNDASLVLGLLRTIQSWTRRPDEVVILDDGSAEAFSLPQDLLEELPPVRILRFPENRGFAVAKQSGINAAVGTILFSADSDARVHPEYLERCCEHLQHSTIGLVGGCSLVDAGGGPLGRYLRYFGDNYITRETRQVDFLPGVAFCLRREVWDEVGGLSAHQGTTCEDHTLCALLRERGYAIVMDAGIHVVQVRKLSRHAQCKRLWLWCGPALLRSLHDSLPLSEQFLHLYIVPMLQRAKQCVEREDLVLIYYDLLYVTFAAFAFCRELAGQNKIVPGAERNLASVLQEGLRDFPTLARLLKMDLLRLGVMPGPDSSLESQKGSSPSAPLVWEADWGSAFAFFTDFARLGILSWLDQHALPLLASEEQHRDFSSYFQEKG